MYILDTCIQLTSYSIIKKFPQNYNKKYAQVQAVEAANTPCQNIVNHYIANRKTLLPRILKPR